MLLRVNKYLIILLGLAGAIASAQEVRVKDLINIRGVRSNQVMGIGLVIGLSKTGDSPKALTTNRAVASMLTRLGLRTTSSEVVSGSVAAVVVTAELPAFSRIGDRIDLRVSTFGDAKSLAGGTLILTSLRAGDGNTYAMGSGSVVVGQAGGSGPQVLTVATAPEGGIVEKEFNPIIDGTGKIIVSLKRPDFTTNQRIVEKVNEFLRGFYAESKDIASIEIAIPEPFRGKTVEFISAVEGLLVKADQKAVVVINERTGTVVMGGDVVIAPITISHGDLSITVGGGSGKPKQSKTVVNMGGSTVGKLIESMNAMGMKPADLVGILQAIEAAGALQAELRFM